MFSALIDEVLLGSVREFINDELSVVREHRPNLVPVAASLLPFTDVVERFGVYDNGDDDFGIIVQVNDKSSMPAFVWHALISETGVRLIKVPADDSYDGPPVEVVPTKLCAFWEYLRQLPRPPSSFLVTPDIALMEDCDDEEDED